MFVRRPVALVSVLAVMLLVPSALGSVSELSISPDRAAAPPPPPPPKATPSLGKAAARTREAMRLEQEAEADYVSGLTRPRARTDLAKAEEALKNAGEHLQAAVERPSAVTR